MYVQFIGTTTYTYSAHKINKLEFKPDTKHPPYIYTYNYTTSSMYFIHIIPVLYVTYVYTTNTRAIRQWIRVERVCIATVTKGCNIESKTDYYFKFIQNK